MINKNILLALIILFVFNGCYVGPATYEVWKSTRDIRIGMKIGASENFYNTKNKKKCMTKTIIFIYLKVPKTALLDF